MKTKEIKEKLLAKRESRTPKPTDYVSTGSTLLNMAITGNPNWGFAKGHYYHFVGDSESGKTWFCLTCFAEAMRNPNFKDYRIIHDDVEGGALMDMRKFFGETVAERIEAPRMVKEEPVYSRTIEDFYYNVDDAIKDGRPFIYVCDSMDGLQTDAEERKFDENKKAYRQGKELKGSYGMSKPKQNSAGMPSIVSRIKETGSILIIISQTRDNVSPMSMGGKTNSGGHALKFYAGLQIWSSVKGLIEKNVKGKKRQIGKLAKVRVKKNRITGRDRTVFIPFFHSYGIDDTRSCITYLVSEGHWKKKQGKIEAPEFDFTGKEDALIRHIEDKKMVKDLKDLVADVWNEIEKACEVKRAPRYV